ncbi:peroxisome biogenesis factor 10 [Blastocladiella emersonii ATCC 22665]|nr:peroxisome biogenesis factor 10 [Blastocladiella emersonii ATCC 22665]
MNTPAQPPATPSFPFAPPPDLIRAAQKDDAYVASVRHALDSVLASLLGPRLHARYSRLLDPAAATVYYALTTGRAAATLGEEYCDLAPVDAGGRRAPGRLSRAGYILAQSLALPLVRWYLTSTSTSTSSDWRSRAAAALKLAAPLHLAAFYFFGTYYRVARRVAGIRTLSLAKPAPDATALSYAPLGWLILVQVLVTAAGAAWTARRAAAKSAKPAPATLPSATATADLAESAADCVLCMSACESPALCPCGHVFCWPCVGAWLHEKPECPLCRDPCALRDLVCVDY